MARLSKTEQEKRHKICQANGLLNRSQMSKSLEVSTSTINAWGISPVEIVGSTQYFNCRSILDNRLRRQKEKLEKQYEETHNEENSLDYQTLRLTKARAHQLEIKNAVSEGKLVPIHLITEILAEVSGECAGYLDTIPSKIKRKFPELDSELVESIRWHIVKAMNNIADSTDVIDRVLEDYEDGQETYKTD